MADYQAILDEEFEVLESIFPDELEKLSDRQVRIRIDPEEPSTSHPVSIYLIVDYPDTYPDIIPGLSFEPAEALEGTEDEPDEDDVDGTGSKSEGLSETEEQVIRRKLEDVAEESLGMAMTFTLAQACREALAEIVQARVQWEKDEDDRKAREYEAAEAERTRGTPVTVATFTKWRQGFSRELLDKRKRDEDERVKGLVPKEREEYRKRRERLTGKQLFESSAALAASDEGMYDEGATEVDLSQYTREEREAERRRVEEEEERRAEGLVRGDIED